jgi:hypothetical protein
MKKLAEAKKKLTKENLTLKIIDVLSDSDQVFPSRDELAKKIGTTRATIYRHYTPAELCVLEKLALEERRKRYANKIAKIDESLMGRALDGDVPAIKLVYQRLEGWSEKHDLNVGGSITINVIRRFGEQSDG